MKRFSTVLVGIGILILILALIATAHPMTEDAAIFIGLLGVGVEIFAAKVGSIKQEDTLL